MRSPWSDWFSRDPELFASVYKRNRETLSRIPTWLERDSLESSLWRYGVPDQWDEALDSVEAEVTYSDLIGFLGHRLDRLRYLEIGVSVGKNFLQLVEQFPEAEIVGLDVEDINPVLASQFDQVETVWRSPGDYEVETLAGSARIRLTEFRLHRSGGKPVTYLKGDQYSPDTWARLEGRSFNLIFSDGVHSPRALRDEHLHISRNELLDTSGPFAVYWDDLVNTAMQEAFDEIASGLPGWHGLHWIHGTYGERRLNGLAANFSGDRETSSL